MLLASNTWLVISDTDMFSISALCGVITGAYDDSMKWMRGYGTRLVWNSLMSTFSAPLKRSEAVMEEITCAISLFRMV